jgi:hypothetical protein
MNEARLRELAETLREELPHVVRDHQERAAIEQDLDAALGRPHGEVEQALVDVLKARPETAAWAAERIEADDFADLRFVDLPGATTALGFHVVCPNGDYDVYLESANEDVGRCPYDGLRLVPAND